MQQNYDKNIRALLRMRGRSREAWAFMTTSGKAPTKRLGSRTKMQHRWTLVRKKYDNMYMQRRAHTYMQTRSWPISLAVLGRSLGTCIRISASPVQESNRSFPGGRIASFMTTVCKAPTKLRSSKTKMQHRWTLMRKKCENTYIQRRARTYIQTRSIGVSLVSSAAD